MNVACVTLSIIFGLGLSWFLSSRQHEKDLTIIREGIAALQRGEPPQSARKTAHPLATRAWVALIDLFQSRAQAAPIRPGRLLALTGRLFAHADSKERLQDEAIAQLLELTSDYVSSVALSVRTATGCASPRVLGPLRNRLTSQLERLFVDILESEPDVRCWGDSHSHGENFSALGIERWLYIPCRDHERTIAGIWLGLKSDLIALPMEALETLETVGECFASALRAALRVAERNEAGDRRNATLLNFSHDIRSPSANALLMLKELQLSNSYTNSDARLLQNIEDCLFRQLELITSALSSERVERSCHPVALPLAPLVARLAEEYRLAASAKQITIANDILSERSVFVDAQHLVRVLDNLLSNAVRYGSSGRIDIAVRFERSVARITIIDDGPGVPAAQEQSLFERVPFRRSALGFGLGLASARELARANGGDLIYERPADRGACFVLTLPLPPEPARPSFRSALIVDDIPAVCRTISRYLTDSVESIYSAATIADAERMLVEHSPDVLITDWRLGEHSAEPLIKRFFERTPPTRRIVLLTGAGAGFDALHRYNVRVLTKPTTRESLLAALSPGNGQPS